MDLNLAAANVESTDGPSQPDAWIDNFMSFLEAKSDVCTTPPCDFSDGVDLSEDQMKTHIATFIVDDANKRFAQDLVLENGMITASRSWLYHVDIETTNEQVEAMQKLTDFCETWQGLTLKPFPSSWIYIYVYQVILFSKAR